MLQDIKEYDLCDMHNADKIGLFLRVQASKISYFSWRPLPQQKETEQQVTVLLACSDKQPPLVISKHRCPRCFKNVTTEL